MNLPFGKKKKSAGARGAAAPAGSKLPATARVSALSAQGLSEPEIIRSLKSEGYSPMEVDGAMKQALRTAVGAERPVAPQPQPIPRAAPPLPQMEPGPMPPTQADRRRIFAEETLPPPARPPQRALPTPPLTIDEMQRMQKTGTGLELPDNLDEPDEPLPGATPGGPGDEFKIPGIGEGQMPLPGTPPRPRQPRPEGMIGRRDFEEVAEAIVEERADIFRREVDGVSDEIKRLDAKLHLLEERFHRIETSKRSEIDEIKGSITGYKESMGEVSARMESVERAMKDSMTPMMQTLRALSEAVKDLKKK